MLDSHEEAYTFKMFKSHSIKTRSALPLVDMCNPTMRYIKYFPAVLFGPPTVLHILVEIEKSLIKPADIRKSLPSNNMAGSQEPVDRANLVVIPISHEMLLHKG